MIRTNIPIFLNEGGAPSNHLSSMQSLQLCRTQDDVAAVDGKVGIDAFRMSDAFALKKRDHIFNRWAKRRFYVNMMTDELFPIGVGGRQSRTDRNNGRWSSY
jgi:hypothetical protein